MKLRFALGFVVMLAMLFACTPADAPAPAADLLVTDAWVRTTAADGTSAAYMTITNGTGTLERLIRASADAADVTMLHETVIEGGIARMDHLTGIDIAPGQSIALEPIGYHLMLIGLRHELVVGEQVSITLEFDSGKTITVDADVRPLVEGGS